MGQQQQQAHGGDQVEEGQEGLHAQGGGDGDEHQWCHEPEVAVQRADTLTAAGQQGGAKEGEQEERHVEAKRLVEEKGVGQQAEQHSRAEQPCGDGIARRGYRGGDGFFHGREGLVRLMPVIMPPIMASSIRIRIVLKAIRFSFPARAGATCAATWLSIRGTGRRSDNLSTPARAPECLIADGYREQGIVE